MLTCTIDVRFTPGWGLTLLLEEFTECQASYAASVASHTEEGTSHLYGVHLVYLLSHHLCGVHTVYEGYTVSVGFIPFMWVALLYGSTQFTKFEWCSDHFMKVSISGQGQ